MTKRGDPLEKAIESALQAGRFIGWKVLPSGWARRKVEGTGDRDPPGASPQVGFMPGFEAIVAGKRARVDPSLLDRARMQWARRAKP